MSCYIICADHPEAKTYKSLVALSQIVMNESDYFLFTADMGGDVFVCGSFTCRLRYYGWDAVFLLYRGGTVSEVGLLYQSPKP